MQEHEVTIPLAADEPLPEQPDVPGGQSRGGYLETYQSLHMDAFTSSPLKSLPYAGLIVPQHLHDSGNDCGEAPGTLLPHRIQADDDQQRNWG